MTCINGELRCNDRYCRGEVDQCYISDDDIGYVCKECSTMYTSKEINQSTPNIGDIVDEEF